MAIVKLYNWINNYLIKMIVAKQALVRSRPMLRKEITANKIFKDVMPDATNLLSKLTSSYRPSASMYNNGLNTLENLHGMSKRECFKDLSYVIATFYKPPYLYFSMEDYQERVASKTLKWKSLQLFSSLYYKTEDKKKPFTEFYTSRAIEVRRNLIATNKSLHENFERIIDISRRYAYKLPNFDNKIFITPIRKVFDKQKEIIENRLGPYAKFNRTLFYDDSFVDFDRRKGFVEDGKIFRHRRVFKRPLGIIRNLKKQLSYSREYFDRRFTNLWKVFHERREVFILKYTQPPFVKHTRTRIRTFSEGLERLKIAIKNFIGVFNESFSYRKNDKRALIIRRFANMLTRIRSCDGSTHMYKRKKNTALLKKIIRSKLLYIIIIYKLSSWFVKLMGILIFGKESDRKKNMP